MFIFSWYYSIGEGNYPTDEIWSYDGNTGNTELFHLQTFKSCKIALNFVNGIKLNAVRLYFIIMTKYIKNTSNISLRSEWFQKVTYSKKQYQNTHQEKNEYSWKEIKEWYFA